MSTPMVEDVELFGVVYSILSDTIGKTWARIIILSFFAILFLSAILKLAQQVDPLKKYRSRLKVLEILQQYKEVSTVYEELEQQFNEIAGQISLKSSWIWVPPIIFGGLGFLIYVYYGDLAWGQIASVIYVLSYVTVLSESLLFWIIFSPNKFRAINKYLGAFLGTFVVNYFFFVSYWIFSAPSNNRIISLFYAEVILIVVYLLIVLGYYPRLRKRAMCYLWKSAGFVKDRKLYRVAFPYIEVTTEYGTFYGKLYDFFDEGYLVLRDGIRDIMIPWHDIKHIEVIAGKRIV